LPTGERSSICCVSAFLPGSGTTLASAGWGVVCTAARGVQVALGLAGECPLKINLSSCIPNKEPLIPLDAGKPIVEVLIFLEQFEVPTTTLLVEYQSCNFSSKLLYNRALYAMNFKILENRYGVQNYVIIFIM
jgi:hypothetical protein